ncbi:protein FAM217B [Meriones unguiculatus]|uniref:protein FAM217B n=1 Tax=Meriones unguiculatus TaxID=10047 RepID=UPI000B4F1DB4|nr:protein FAM217B [Meriones unguiculatus]XP_021513715.1 protein FAM217B [Meriones unguiculatus]XP_021513716.1 protein FAM217B [Meriones unguiculatus]XP_060238726.1 protein FAM217B [Meriones unguiculatus]
MSDCHQKSSGMNAAASWNQVQHSKTSSGKRQSRSQGSHISSQLRSSLLGIPQPEEDKLMETISREGRQERIAFSSRYQAAAGSKLFLDFQSMKIIKEGADEDSASDLSDSERVAIPPSPFTPPDLNLRAEEIDPVSFSLHPDPSQAEREHCYPDFLPPPFSSWDLQDMAVVLNTECRNEALPRATGFLGRYIDRLLQLEWLQVQTVQCEKARAAKARPSGASRVLKSPGRGKLLTSTLSKPLPSPEGISKPGPSRKKGFHHEEAHPSYYAFEALPRSLDGPGRPRLCAQKQTPELRMEKKKKSVKGPQLQHRAPPCTEGNPVMEANGNIRIPKQSLAVLDPMDSFRASRTQAHLDPKKKGNANNCGLAPSTSEKKLKTNVARQSTHKLK